MKAVLCSAGIWTVAFDENDILLNDGNWYKDVSSSGWLTVGINENGTVAYWGADATELASELALWSDIKQVCPGDAKAVGLINNGQLEFAGYCSVIVDAQSWTDINKIILFDDIYYNGDSTALLVGIKNDGTVLTSGGINFGNIDSWKNIRDVKLVADTLYSLTEDGNVLISKGI